MKLMLFTCAGSYSVDQRSNSVSVFNIVERIVSPVFPCGFPEVFLVAMIRREAGEPDLALRLVATLNSRILVDTSFEVTFFDSVYARGFGGVGGLPIVEPGVLSFALWHEKRKWGEWTVEMVDAAARAQGEDSPSPAHPEPPLDAGRKPELLN